MDRAATPDMLSSTKLNLFLSLRQQPANNVQDQLKTLIGKSFDTGDTDEKNLNDSTSSYKPFTGDELYYGVNLNTMLLPTESIASGTEKNRLKRCSCHLEVNTSERKQHQVAKRPTSFHALPRNYQFSHRNIQLSDEDYQNLENEAMEVCKKYSYYDTSFWAIIVTIFTHLFYFFFQFFLLFVHFCNFNFDLLVAIALILSF